MNSGGPENKPWREQSQAADGRDQRKEGADVDFRESDLPMVVRDGKAVHKAKGRAEGQSGQSTHARERNTPKRSVSSTLSALGAKARREPGHKFRGLARLLDRRMLGEAFARLRKGAAAGIDGVRHAEYAENLEGNLVELERRLKHGQYRARSVRRRWIPKPGGRKLRPLGIPVIEDKIVQQAVAMILGAIWEEDFADESVGYRPGRGARETVLGLREELNGGTYRWVVEADIRGYFENIDHGWLVKMLEQRIADRGLVRLITKWLKAGILEEDGRTVNPETGTPQGGVISPVLANIYLHYVQDLWIRKVVAKRSKGRVIFRRYADDSVVCFEREEDARRYLRELQGRLAKFNLEIAGEKSALVKFNRWRPEESGKFTFLGFDFYWGRTRRNRKFVVVKLRTQPKKFRASLLALKEWLKLARSQRLPGLLETLRRKLQGHFNYYGVIGNSRGISSYHYHATRLLYKWLNRRSQRKSFGWQEFLERLPSWRLPVPRIRPANPQMKLQWQENHA